ncbi:AfsR/SARP family transcriptional regulator [Lentzea alba]|uniref:AfsR/SARP family transcriptional regulator n=1 Tax=Lentzea alba TaxID=2714351 RepID=UPI0039BF07CC
MDFRLLGPVSFGSPQQSGVLAVLLLSSHVTLEDLVCAVWGPDAPAGAASTVRTYVSRLRLLTGCAIVAEAGGYRMVVDPATVDVSVFLSKLRLGQLKGALDLWRGRALDGLSGAFFDSRRTWLDQLRATAQEDLWAASLGDPAVIGELVAATAAEPYRERVWELLIEALVRRGRCAEALAAQRRITRLLDEDLGLRPGPGLRVQRLSTPRA